VGGHLSSLVVANEIKRFTRRYYGSGPLHPSLFNLSPSGVCIASDVTTRAVGSYIKSIMTPPFHPYPMKRWDGIFSVALSFPSPGLRVTEHCVLWSSDFPPALSQRRKRAGDHLVYSSSKSPSPLFRNKIRPQLWQKVRSLPDKS